MAGRSRRKLSPQFKAESVQLVIHSDRPIVEVAGELGIIPGTIGNWVNKYREENPEPEQKLTPADHARLAELEVENCRLRMESEFLKKPRPYSRGSRTEREVSPDRSGEGHLPHRLDVSPAPGAPFHVLRLEGPRRPGHGHSGAARAAQGGDLPSLRGPERHGRVLALVLIRPLRMRRWYIWASMPGWTSVTRCLPMAGRMWLVNCLR